MCTFSIRETTYNCMASIIGTEEHMRSNFQRKADLFAIGKRVKRLAR